ncbi:CoA protein activase [Calderihabitans maritimus]|uniref:DUF2229 domain-containing protein n=1 Tax=Calderihabitans maritimus TaxID=1246530 RepID=A0A1Z5HPK0_9FIRM|nr:CoA protein activase [Calderihabitans maritimus]GAW91358.1 hypothetical protein TherJR_1648 [Calderihabitans maritimus]
MKVTFPHMGNLYIVVRALLEELGLEVVVPPACSKRTLTLGARHSPEFACLPLKVNLGNYMEAAERGADTILMAGGVGPCRFGYYAEIQREILKDLGYEYEMVVLEPPDQHFSEVLAKIRYLTGRRSWKEIFKALRLAWWKALAVDRVERRVQYLRPREEATGRVDEIYRKALGAIDDASGREAIDRAVKQAEEELNSVPQREGPVLKIGIVGEIYTILEPFVNLNMERHLGRLGAEVRRSIYLSEWIDEHLFFGLLGTGGSRKVKKLAVPHLNSFVGGHGRETVGCTVRFAREGFQGVIQVAPLTCMPEIVAHSILPGVGRQENIPVMTFYVDEQSGEAGIVTRLEAFLDLVGRSNYKEIGLVQG